MFKITLDQVYRPFLMFFRTRRMKSFKEIFRVTKTTKILDVGGTYFVWTLVPDLPIPIIVNVSYPGNDNKQTTWIVADGRRLPFADRSFDIVYSNSVIEHLGTFENQLLFAKECRRVGGRYYVQTPNRWFFIEPHFLTPFIHYLPKRFQRKLLKWTVWAMITNPSEERIEAVIEEIRLLDEHEFRILFPDAQILKEKVLWFTKSLIAVRT